MVTRQQRKPGLWVRTTMGVRLVGIILPRMPYAYTDGSYRSPYEHERRDAIPVRWTDGTVGWSHAQHLTLTETP